MMETTRKIIGFYNFPPIIANKGGHNAVAAGDIVYRVVSLQQFIYLRLLKNGQVVFRSVKWE